MSRLTTNLSKTRPIISVCQRIRSLKMSTDSSQKPLVSVVKDSVHTITMNSPKTRNSLSLEVLQALRAEIGSCKSKSDVRCVVLRSSGPVFSSGHNLKELTHDHGREYQEKVFRECNHLMHEILRLPVPVLAAVQGLAAAAGCQLVAMCDIAIATEKAQFSTPGSNFGLFCSTPGIPLARAVPRKVSSYMLLTGKTISGHDALRSGLVSRLARDDQELEEMVVEAVEAIKAKPKAVVELGKRFYYQQLEMGISEALNSGAEVMVDNLQLKDAQEGLAAFKEKRSPVWTHTDERVD